MAQPTALYNGDYITCYPGSNQTDDGKLQLEFNMARLVTRVSSKNFCIVNPSFELKVVTNNLGKQQIQIGEGQCSINGMDLIMSQTLTIDAPEGTGKFYLAFKLARNDLNNVLGDLKYGASVTFQGLYATYFTEKIDTDKDRFYLGSFDYDGTSISNLTEDKDKYGRIWAEDILAKINDPKHPEVTRLILQDWLDKVPDWYVSKEGDTEYGAIDFMAGRTTESTFGIHIQAEDENNSYIQLKAPSVESDDPRNILVHGSTNGIDVKIGNTHITSLNTNNFDLDITTTDGIKVKSARALSLLSDIQSSIGINNDIALSITPSLAAFKKANIDLTDSVEITTNALTHIIGKTQFTYSNGVLSVNTPDTTKFKVSPNFEINNGRVCDTLYIGNNTTFGTERTFLKMSRFKVGDILDDETYSYMDPSVILSNSNDLAEIIAQNTTKSKYAKLSNAGILELKNNNADVKILFRGGQYGANITKPFGKDELDVTATLLKVNGNLTATGDIRANRVYNAVYNDIAEFMEKTDYAEDIEAGDVVYFDNNNKVCKWKESIVPTAIAGVVSSEKTYGYALGGANLKDNQKVPVALKGRVILKVPFSDIQAGDVICVDDKGELYKGLGTEGIFILGIATEPDKDGKVTIMIK